MKKIIPYICRSIATFGPVGYVPYFPGTLGTICSIPLVILIHQNLLPLPYFDECFFVALCFFASIWIINRALVLFNQVQDPSEIVLDEVVGFFIVMLHEPFTLSTMLLGFIYFRFFDIVKPFGIDRLERIPDGWGIMLDDAAAAYAAHVMLGITRLFL